MGQIDEAIQEHAEECARTLETQYVSWQRVVALFCGSLGLVATTAVAGVLYVNDIKGDTRVKAQRNNTQDQQISTLQKQLSSDIAWIRRKLDR